MIRVISSLVIVLAILALCMGPNIAWARDTNSRIYQLESRVENLENYSHTEYGVLTVPAAAFQSWIGGNPYWVGYGYVLNNWHAGIEHYVAPVNLPQNATILSFTGHFRDNLVEPNITIELTEQPWGTYTRFVLASLTTSGAPGFVALTDSKVARQLVDNLNSQYWVYLFLPPHRDPYNAIGFEGAVIEYEVTR